MDDKKFRLRSFTKLESVYIIRCGSFYELPLKYWAANPTDEDEIIYYYDICAIPWNRNPPKNTKCTVLRIDSKQTPPGFVRLRVDRDNKEDNPTYLRRPPVLREIRTGAPSFSCERRLTHNGRTFLKVNQNAIAADIVPAVYCPYWPVEAEEWRKRKRFNGWPNEKLIARITRGGCHFVSKLRTWSSCDDTDWRFSFSKAELLLIHSWTNVQKHVYHVIRLIKRRMSRNCGGAENKALQTYYFKTLMFWACEEFPQEFWTEQNLSNCVLLLLLRFLQCLYEKFCPSYFIPECNIMSHFKCENGFDKWLQAVQIFRLMFQTFFRNEISIVAKENTPQSGMPVFLKVFELVCIYMTLHSLPLNKELNGRMAQYVSECEWFLPEMKHLRAAIVAHLRLMLVDGVNERKERKDYIVCVENFESASLNSEWFESAEYLNPDKSLPENCAKIFVHKLLRNSVVVYRRMSHREEAIYKVIKDSNISILHCVTSAYRANFYFTALQSYDESLSECEKCFEELQNKAEIGFLYHSPSDHSSFLSVLVCNSFSQIFDEHLQVTLGFVTLHRNISFSNSPITVTSEEVCLKLNAWEFLKYIYIQCEQKLDSTSELTDCSFSANSDSNESGTSQLVDSISYSAAILFAALRQSRAYRNTLMGSLIPDHISQKK